MDGIYDADVESNIYEVHNAAAQGNVGQITDAVRHDPSVLEQEDAEGLTPLVYAVKNQQLAVMKKLIKLGANINAQDKQGRTCLATAVYQGWYDGMVYLLRKGANQKIPEKSGRTPIHASTYDKDIRIIGALLQTMSKSDVSQTDNEKMTAVHWAAFHSRPEHIQLLLMNGVSLMARDVDGKTALHWAAQNGSVECCHIIITCCKGAELINLQDYSGKTAVHYAAAAGHQLVLKQMAAVDGCQLEVEDPDERTPLHWATAMGQSACVKLLLEKGVVADPVDIEGGTPLDYARQSGHSECIKLLETKLGIKPSNNVKQKWKKHDSSDSDKNKKSTSQSGQSRKATTSDTRSPFGKLKDLFRSKTKRHSSTSVVSDVTSNSIEMSVMSSNDNTHEKSNGIPNNLTASAPKDIPKSSQVIVPKIVLSSYDSDEGDGILLKQRRRNKKSKKGNRGSRDISHDIEVTTIPEFSGRHGQQVSMLSGSPSLILPPVMSPRTSPIPPRLSALDNQDFLSKPPPHKSMKELAPLRVPTGAEKKHDRFTRLHPEIDIGASKSPLYGSLSGSIEKMKAREISEEQGLNYIRQHKALTNSSHPSQWVPVHGGSYGELLTVEPRYSPSRRDSSDHLSVSSGQRSRRQSQDLISASSSQRSRRPSHEYLSVSSGQRSGRSSSRSSNSGDSRLKLSPIPGYGSNPLLSSGSPQQLSTLEKRTLDRTIQSLLH